MLDVPSLVPDHLGKLVFRKRTSLIAEQNHDRHKYYLGQGPVLWEWEQRPVPGPCNYVAFVICLDCFELVPIFEKRSILTQTHDL